MPLLPKRLCWWVFWVILGWQIFLFFLIRGWHDAFWASILEESSCSMDPGAPRNLTSSLNQGLSSGSGRVCGPPEMPWPHPSSAPKNRELRPFSSPRPFSSIANESINKGCPSHSIAPPPAPPLPPAPALPEPLSSCYCFPSGLPRWLCPVRSGQDSRVSEGKGLCMLGIYPAAQGCACPLCPRDAPHGDGDGLARSTGVPLPPG